MEKCPTLLAPYYLFGGWFADIYGALGFEVFQSTKPSVAGSASETVKYVIGGFKTPSKARMRRCSPHQNAHISVNMLRFFFGLRLAFRPDLSF
jgi:hypothetical protein